MKERFEVLTDKNNNSGIGPIDYKNVKGYQCGNAPTLDEARMLMGSLRTVKGMQDARIWIVDASTYNGDRVEVLFDSTKP